MTQLAPLTIDGKEVTFDQERNLLELIRKTGVEIPTFCYHSELSVYGACRLCLVEIEGRGVVTSCSTLPEPGLVVRTNTERLRQIRRINLELMLANHPAECPTCVKSATCKLQELARKLGVRDVRFKRTTATQPIDCSSPSLVRDPNKCILCGDCVRACREVQGIGAIDFAYRGQHARVMPAFGKGLAEVDCVHCGQCASVCPTGAITPRSATDEVWRALSNPRQVVVAQVAPAVRVALGEAFGLPDGEVSTGRIVAALKALGFARVYDTAFAADLTVFEEGVEFLERCADDHLLPLFTSCCPAWVAYAEQNLPHLLPHLSTCRSPQQMFGSLAKELLPSQLGVGFDDLVVVSIMPCTAKKAEAKLEKFHERGVPDVDHVLTTVELARMIEERGLRFQELAPEPLDHPFGVKSGAGLLFGASGGVSEAVIRFATHHLGIPTGRVERSELRGNAGVRTATFDLAGRSTRLAVVHGLANARQLCDSIRKGEVHYDLVEVMACPGGCIGGAGQPECDSARRARRREAIYEADRSLPLHGSHENDTIWTLYERHLGAAGGETAHRLLHTHYQSRRRIQGARLPLFETRSHSALRVSVCAGTSCYLRGAQGLLQSLSRWVRDHGLQRSVTVDAHFCLESCDRGPSVTIGTTHLHHANLERAKETILRHLGIAEPDRVLIAAPATVTNESTPA